MAMKNPTGRANYEPNSWGKEEGGPRENPDKGFTSYPAQVSGDKQRVRSETFSDHYSQARQFYISQTEEEQTHIADAFIFELSKVEKIAIRERMVAHLLNVDTALAQGVAQGLGIDPLPRALEPAVNPRDDLPASDALSILKNGPKTFKGRKLGILLTDGADGDLLSSIESVLKQEGAVGETVAPHSGEIKDDKGRAVAVTHKVDGGPSVLFDAVVVVPSKEGVKTLSALPPAQNFVRDAFHHKKFIGFSAEAQTLLDEAGIAYSQDQGCTPLKDEASIKAFIQQCAGLRYWARM